MNYLDGFAQNCSNSNANALELLQSCATPSIWAVHSKCITAQWQMRCDDHMLHAGIAEQLHSVWNKRKFLVAGHTTNGGRLGGPVSIELSVEVMCWAHFTIFTIVDVIYPSMLMSYILRQKGLEFPIGPSRWMFIGRPVDLWVTSGDLLFYTLNCNVITG